MILPVQLSHYRRARVWLNELPAAGYQPSETLSRVAEAKPGCEPKYLMAALEVLVPSGPRSIYGLLGAHYDPAGSDRLVTEIGVSTHHGPTFAGSLAGSLDDVRVGLPDEYGDGAMTGALRAQLLLESVAPGRIRFDCAAHGAMGSSSDIFTRLAAVLVVLFHLRDSVESTSVLEAVIQRHLDYGPTVSA